VKKISKTRIEQARRWLRRNREAPKVAPALERAASFFDLDPKDPRLAYVLAQLLFGPGKRGRPSGAVKWRGYDAHDLGRHVHCPSGKSLH
jgi:hypothetical protein